MAGAAGGPAADTAPALRAVTEAIIAQTSLGVWVLDVDDRTTFVNERMADMVSATRAEMLGAPVYDFLDPRAAESTRVALQRRRRGITELREMPLRRRDGSTMHALVESMPLHDPAGNYIGAVAMVGDITARKQIEREVGLLAGLVQSSSDAIVGCSLDGSVQSWTLPPRRCSDGRPTKSEDVRSGRSSPPATRVRCACSRPPPREPWLARSRPTQWRKTARAFLSS